MLVWGVSEKKAELPKGGGEYREGTLNGTVRWTSWRRRRLNPDWEHEGVGQAVHRRRGPRRGAASTHSVLAQESACGHRGAGSPGCPEKTVDHDGSSHWDPPPAVSTLWLPDNSISPLVPSLFHFISSFSLNVQHLPQSLSRWTCFLNSIQTKKNPHKNPEAIKREILPALRIPSTLMLPSFLLHKKNPAPHKDQIFPPFPWM